MGFIRNVGWIGILAIGIGAAMPFYRAPSKAANHSLAKNEMTRNNAISPLERNHQFQSNYPRVDVERTPAGAVSMLEPPRLKLEPSPAKPPLVSLPDWANPTDSPPVLDSPPPVFTPVFVRKKQPSQVQTRIAEPEIKPTLSRVRRHRLVDGDSIRLLALRYYGDEQRANEIVAANAAVICNPELLPIGQEIVIPAP